MRLTFTAVATALLLSAPLIHAQAIPEITGTPEEGWLKSVRQIQGSEAYKSGAMFTAEGLAHWPCKVDDVTLARLARLSHDQPTTKREGGGEISLLGVLGSASRQEEWSYADARYRPITASCENGKLSGDLKFVVTYVTIQKSSSRASRYGIEKHVEVKVKDGRAVGPTTEVARIRSEKHQADDAMYESMLNNPRTASQRASLQAIAISAPEGPRRSEMVVFSMDSTKGLQRIDGMGVIRRPLDGGGRRQVTFNKEVLTVTEHDAEGILVGETTRYARAADGAYLRIVE